MHVPEQLLDQLDLRAAVARIMKRSLDHFPPLVISSCLSDAENDVARHVRAVFADGSPVHSETLTMPRRGGNPRPVDVMAVPGRALYDALVNHLSPALPAPSRQKGAWEEHRLFGISGSHAHVIDLDIAACYEFIDHDLLYDELLLRSMDAPASRATRDLLGHLYSRRRGLPQMIAASDHLADTYLSQIDRRLQRDGLSIHRYADDIRVLAADWEAANTYMERAAEYARAVGLILSTEKSKIYRKDTLIDLASEDSAFFETYFTIAREELTQLIVWASGPYTR